MAVGAASELVLTAQPHGTAGSHKTFPESRAQFSGSSARPGSGGQHRSLGVFRMGSEWLLLFFFKLKYSWFTVLFQAYGRVIQ